MADDPSTEVKCPICGATAEAGVIYADDRSDLRWFPGDPSWRKNFKAAMMAGGERVGEFSFPAGAHVRGIFCRVCDRIVIDVPKPVNHYPDVRG